MDGMVIVRLKGGIGNQMFQFACARAVALYRQQELFLDLVYLTRNPLNFVHRDFKLQRLTDFQIADDNTLKYFDSLYVTGNAAYITDDFPKQSYLELLNFEPMEGILLDGYFQDEFYLLNYTEVIKKEFNSFLKYYLNKGPITFIENSANTVSIHLRRQDYMLPDVLKVLGICESLYYDKAMAIMKTLVDHPQYYIFSDDPALAEEYFQDIYDEKINISQLMKKTNLRDSDIIELAMMTQCKHHILANSSYSWWGAYLSDSNSKQIIAPRKWFQDEKLSHLSDAIVLDSWLKI